MELESVRLAVQPAVPYLATETNLLHKELVEEFLEAWLVLASVLGRIPLFGTGA